MTQKQVTYPLATDQKSAPLRRTQEQRTAETTTKILEATLDSIYEIGFQKTTTSGIARRARVSRGALLHHFPVKEKLIASAVRFMLKREVDDIQILAEKVSSGHLALDDFIDDLWARFSGRLFMTTMDYLSAARTDQVLKDVLKPSAKEFNDSLDRIWQQFFQNTAIQSEEKRLALTTTVCLLRGMGVHSILRDDPAFFVQLLAYWKKILKTIVDLR